MRSTTSAFRERFQFVQACSAKVATWYLQMQSGVTPIPSDLVKAIFENDYPTMGSVVDVVSLIQSSPFHLLNHFPLPPEAWWDNFYTPVERIIEEFRGKYVDDPEALEILEQLGLEPVAYRKNLDYCNY